MWITDRFVDLLMDVCVLTFALTCSAILIALAFDAVERLVDKMKEAALRHRASRTKAVKPTRPWGNQRGVVLVSFALILPLLMLLIVGGAFLQLALCDFQRLNFATAEGARAGAAVLSGSGPEAAETNARSVFTANAPDGCSTPVIVITGLQVEVTSTKPVTFMGFLPDKVIGARAVAVAQPM